MNRIILFFLAACSLLAKEKADVLFCLQDAGETYALLPVIHRLEEKGVDVLILASGVAAEGALAGEKRVLTFKDLGIEAKVDRSWLRLEKLSEEQIVRILEEIEVSEVVAGVAFALQGQVLEAYRKEGIPALAFWDNFQPDGENPYFATARSVAALASRVLVPAESFKEAFNLEASMEVVGQPSLETWKEELAAVDSVKVREKLGIGPDEKVAFFIGGYGKDYEEAYRLFAKASANVHFLVQPHPKTGGEFEKSLRKHRVLNGEISTIQGIAIADWVICHQSSAAFQAASVGKSVFYLIPEGQKFDNPLLQTGLAHRLSSMDSFSSVLEVNQGIEKERFYDSLGIPQNSVEKCAQVILREIHEQSIP